LAQTFTVGQTGILNRVELAIDVDAGAVGDLEFALQSTSGGVPSTGTALFTAPIPLASIGEFTLGNVFSTSVDVSSANLFVQPGNVLAWTLARPSAAADVFVYGGGPNYAGGQPFRRASSLSGWSVATGSDRFLRTFVDTDQTSGSVTLNPTVKANVELTGGSYVLELNPFTLFTQQLPSADIDARTLMEFPLATVPDNVTLTAATLHLDCNLRSFSQDEFPDVPVFGYSGDGLATINDASVTTNLLGTSGPITENGPLDIALDVEYIEQLASSGTHLGLAMIGDANGNQAGFENVFTPPTLTLEFSFGLAGDYNDDGVVDAADYTRWRDNLGAPAGTLPNDVDGGVIGAAQYNTWKAEFGSASGGASGVAAVAPVPEPASHWLLLSAVVAGRRTVRIRSRYVGRKRSLGNLVAAGG
jgi:hypothetical protein